MMKYFAVACGLLFGTVSLAEGARVDKFEGCFNIPGPDGSFFDEPEAKVSHSVASDGGQSMWHCKGRHPYDLNRAVRIDFVAVNHSCWTPDGSTQNAYVQLTPSGEFHLRCSL